MACPLPCVDGIQGQPDHSHGLTIEKPQAASGGRWADVVSSSQDVLDAVQRLAQLSRDNAGRP